MKTIRRSIFLFSIFLIHFSSFSQTNIPNNNFHRYNLEDGLSQNVVRSIKQDSQGYLWIGTEDGLNKFDGYDFRIFRKEVKDSTSLADNFIYSLEADKNGVMWVGTNSGGLARFNPKTENFEVYQHNEDNPESISDGRIYSLHIDPSGDIWAGTFGGGLNLFKKKHGTFKHFKNDPNNPTSLSSNNIYAIASDKNGNLWIRTEKDINKFNKSSELFTSYDVPGNELVFEQTNSMFMDKDEILWIAYPGGIMKFNIKNEKSTLVELPEFQDNTITSICQHTENLLWIGSYNGLYLFNKKEQMIVKSYTHDPSNVRSINDDMIVTLFKDNTGSLWIAHGNTGITKLNTKQKEFKHYKHNPDDPNSIPGNIIRALMVDSKNRIWIGTRNNGTSILNRSTSRVSRLTPNPGSRFGMYSERTTCFYEDEQGNIYLGSWGAGIRKLRNGNPDAFRIAPTYKGNDENSLRDSIVQAIYKDQDGTLWIGLEAGLDLYNTQTGEYRHIMHDSDDSNSIAPLGVQSNCIVEDANGNFWIGTWGGLTMMRPVNQEKNTFNTEYDYYRLSDNLSDKRVISMHYSKNIPGTIFVGTYGGGLNKITINFENPVKSKVETYTKADGLCNNVIYGILSDELGSLWLSTNNGLARFNITDETFTTFDANDGLQSSQFRWGAYAKGKNNELLFGGPNGFNAFNAKEINRDSTLPKVVITDFKIFNQSVLAGDKINNKVILEKNINQAKKITLSYKEDVFSFEFAALHYAFPEDNNYKYKLEGFDKEWIEVTSEKRFATYTNLDPDVYTFKVMASNYDGVWNPDPKEIVIEIKPPFWQRTWFYILIGVLVTSIVIVIVRLRMRAIRHEKELLQQKVNEAVSEVEKQKEVMEEKNQELMKTQEEIKRNNWIANSIAKFGDILREEHENMQDFSYNIISKLVKHVGANVGAIYLLNDEDENDPYIEMAACYAYEKKKDFEKKIYLGEGLVGKSIKDQEITYLTKLPENYITIKSGLGKTNPDALLIVPLVTGDEVYGAIELATIGDFKEIYREFIQDVSEDIAITIKTTQINMRTNKLLEQSKEQYEELASQKEEMQQNMEELKATQEEAGRRKAEMENLIDALKKSNFFIKYDKDGYIQDINDKFLNLYNKNYDELVGKHYSDLHKIMKKKNGDFKQIWEELQSGKTQKDTIEYKKNNQTQTLACVYTPILNKEGNTANILQIALDISDHLN